MVAVVVVVITVAVVVEVAVRVAVVVVVEVAVKPLKVYELSHDGGVLGDLLRRARAAESPRTGLHCSTIVNDLLALSDPKTYRQLFDPTISLAFQEIGNALEGLLAAQLRQRIQGWAKPTPGQHRGIHYSPDGWRPQSRAVDEIKACWKTARGFIDVDPMTHELMGSSLKLQGYLWQLLFYMEAMNARRGYLHVLFVNGNYRPPFPMPRTFTIVPTRRELRANSDVLVQHAVDRGWLASETI